MQLEELKQKLAQSSHPDSRRFHALMSHRVKTILMVSTQYEAFSLSWDGSLTEDIYGAYSLLHLQNVPQITTVTSGQEALEKLQRENQKLLTKKTVTYLILITKNYFNNIYSIFSGSIFLIFTNCGNLTISTFSFFDFAYNDFEMSATAVNMAGFTFLKLFRETR